MDATQREGLRLEDLLRDLGRTLDQASGPAGRAPDRRLPAAQEVEERESLEVAPEAQSLEIDPRRGERAVVDQDDAAEQVIARRLAAARGEIAHVPEFEYVIINDDFDRAAQELISVIRAERLRLPRQLARHTDLINRLTGTS